MALGAAALNLHPPAVVARAVELYLEHHATRAIHGLPPGTARREVLEAATTDLRAAGLLTDARDTTRPRTHADHPGDEQATSGLEHAAQAYTADLGAPTDSRQLANLAAPPANIENIKPRTGLPHGSANGHRASLAVVADELDPLGPDAATLDDQRRAADRAARTLSAATTEAADKRRRKGKTR